ncbi:Inhibitor of growth protein 5, partial [Chytridiales sp. JEL 0842]
MANNNNKADKFAMVYLEDYLDTIESLPMELSRNFSLLKELDGSAQDLMTEVEQKSKQFMETMESMTSEERISNIQSLTKLFKEYVKHGEEK